MSISFFYQQAQRSTGLLDYTGNTQEKTEVTFSSSQSTSSNYLLPQGRHPGTKGKKMFEYLI